MKITRDAENVGTLRVNLCGRFTSEYIPEVKKSLSPNRNKAQRLALDLTNVTFVDRQAMEFLTAQSRSIRIDNLPSYVTRWMQQEAANGSRLCRPQTSNSRNSFPACPVHNFPKVTVESRTDGTYVKTRGLSNNLRRQRIATAKHRYLFALSAGLARSDSSRYRRLLSPNLWGSRWHRDCEYGRAAARMCVLILRRDDRR